MITKTRVTIEIDIAGLRSYSDEHLAALWHVAQANPADGFATGAAGELVERIGREIVRRWLHSVEPQLWHHQGHHYYWHELQRLGTWNADRVFVPHGTDAGADRGVEPTAGGAR